MIGEVSKSFLTRVERLLAPLFVAIIGLFIAAPAHASDAAIQLPDFASLTVAGQSAQTLLAAGAGISAIGLIVGIGRALSRRQHAMVKRVAVLVDVAALTPALVALLFGRFAAHPFTSSSMASQYRAACSTNL
jgi:hypothetical protein